MSNPFVGQLLLVPFNFAPRGWAFCQGQLLPLSQNTALFSLLGTYYGGDGKTTFALPNLQGSMAVGQGQGSGLSLYSIGEQAGSATVSLLSTELPPHTHTLLATTATVSSFSPIAAAFGQGGGRGHGLQYYAPALTGPTTVTMSGAAVAGGGNNQPHNNMMPSLTLNYIIALQGVYPPRS